MVSSTCLREKLVVYTKDMHIYCEVCVSVKLRKVIGENI